MAKHSFTITIGGGTREGAVAFLHTLFFDRTHKVSPIVDELLEEHTGPGTGITVQ